MALPGCIATRHTTHTPRTATEQLLVAHSAERAVAALALPDVAGQSVGLELITLGPGGESYDDAPYVVEALRERLIAAGATLVESRDADSVFRVRASSIGTVGREFFFGLPAVSLALVATPEIPIFRTSRQRGYTGLRAGLYDRDGSLLSTSEPVLEAARFDVFNLLVLSIRRQDIYPKDGLIGID